MGSQRMRTESGHTAESGFPPRVNLEALSLV